jgi:hypothetical protein
MREIRIVMKVSTDDIDWGKSSITPVGNGLYDYYLDDCKYQGQVIDFKIEDDALEHLEFLHGEAFS